MSLKYIFGQDDLVAGFVAGMIPECRERGFGKCRAVGVVDGRDELIAGIVYHNHNPASGVIDMSVAAVPGQHWLTPTTLKIMAQIPFRQYGCQMLMMSTRADKAGVLRQLGAANFMHVTIPRLYGRDTDGVVSLLTDDDWAANKFCQKYQHHIA